MKWFFVYALTSVTLGFAMMAIDMACGFPSIRHRWMSKAIYILCFGPVFAGMFAGIAALILYMPN